MPFSARRRLVRLLRREAAGLARRQLEALAQQAAQLVLGGDHGDAAAGALERREQRLDPQELRASFIITSLPDFGIEEVVAADAMHLGRPAGDDREVVGIGEGRHHAVGDQAGALCQHPGEPRRAAGLDGALDVAGLRAVDADHDGRPPRQTIAAAVDGNVVDRADRVHRSPLDARARGIVRRPQRQPRREPRARKIDLEAAGFKPRRVDRLRRRRASHSPGRPRRRPCGRTPPR